MSLLHKILDDFTHTQNSIQTFYHGLPAFLSSLSLPPTIIPSHTTPASLAHLLLLCCIKLIPASGPLYLLCFLLGILRLLTSTRLSFMSLKSLLKYYLFREAFPDHSVYNSQFSIILYFFFTVQFFIYDHLTILLAVILLVCFYCLSVSFMSVILCFIYCCVQNETWYTADMQLNVEYVNKLLDRTDL